MERARPLVYFWCIGNAMRSQMAEAYFRRLCGDRYDVASAGTEPLGRVLEDVLEVMEEEGLDLSTHTSDDIDTALVERAHLIVDLGGRGRDRLPSHLLHKYVAWQVVDPYGAALGDLRRTRDLIRERVEALVRELDSRA